MFSQSAGMSKRRIESILLLCMALVFLVALQAGSARATAPLSCSDPIEGEWGYGRAYTVEHWISDNEELLLVGNGTILTLIDASDPSSLTVLGEVSVSDPVRSIAVSADGKFVAVSDWRKMIHLIEINDRSAPQARGSVHAPGFNQPLGLTIVDDLLYVALRDVGIGIFDISDPDNVSMLGITNNVGTDLVFDVKVRGDFAFLGDGAEGFTVVDISDPGNPTFVGAHAASTHAGRVLIDANLAYVARSGYGFDILDISVPAAPSLVASVPNPGGIAYGLQMLKSQRLLVGNGYSGSLVYDVSNPAAPVLIGSESEPVYGLTTIGNIGFTTPDSSRPSHLRAIDFSNPMAPVPIDSMDFYNDTSKAIVAGSHVLVAHRQSGLSILDLANPQAPVRVGGYSSGNDDVIDVEWINGHAVIAIYDGKLEALDVSNPAAPQLVSTITEPGSMLDLDRNGSLLFATWGFNGMRIYDYSNPAMPALLGVFQPATGGPLRVTTQGNYAYVSDSNNVVYIVDVSNPASPQQLGQMSFTAFIDDLSIEGNHLFVATASAQLGVRVIDVSVPGTPVEVSNISIPPANAVSVAARGDRLYMAAHENGGLQIFDIGLPSSPMLVSEFQTPGDAISVDMADDAVAVADGPMGVRTLVCVNEGDDTIFRNGFD